MVFGVVGCYWVRGYFTWCLAVIIRLFAVCGIKYVSGAAYVFAALGVVLCWCCLSV